MKGGLKVFEYLIISVSIIGGIVIGLCIMKFIQYRKIERADDLDLMLGPWENYVGEDKIELLRFRCNNIITPFKSLNHIFNCKNTKDLVDNIYTTFKRVKENDKYNTMKMFGTGTVTPIRYLAISTTEATWNYWRSDTVAVMANTNLYLVASLLDVFIHQSIHSEMSTNNKVRLSHDIRTNLDRYEPAIRDILIIIWVAIDFDDLLWDMDDDNGEFVNYDCIMWGVKKVMERISSDANTTMFDGLNNMTKSKTKKCLSYSQRRKKKENRYE